MNILRKIFGILLLIFSLFLIPASISSSSNTIANIPKEPGAERAGYIFGFVIFVLLMGWLIFFTMKKAIRFLKSKPQNIIDEIGQS